MYEQIKKRYESIESHKRSAPLNTALYEATTTVAERSSIPHPQTASTATNDRHYSVSPDAKNIEEKKTAE